MAVEQAHNNKSVKTNECQSHKNIQTRKLNRIRMSTHRSAKTQPRSLAKIDRPCPAELVKIETDSRPIGDSSNGWKNQRRIADVGDFRPIQSHPSFARRDRRTRGTQRSQQLHSRWQRARPICAIPRSKQERNQTTPSHDSVHFKRIRTGAIDFQMLPKDFHGSHRIRGRHS